MRVPRSGGKRKKNIRKTPKRSNIAWKKLGNKDKREDFKVKTRNIEIQQTSNVFKDWKKLEKGVVSTAEQVCGIKKRQTNDWLTGHMEEFQKLERKEALRVRNEQKRLYDLNQSMRNEQVFNYAVEQDFDRIDLQLTRNRSSYNFKKTNLSSRPAWVTA